MTTPTAGPTIQPRRRRRRWLILAAALLAVAAFAAATLVEARSLRTRTVAFSSPDLPAAFDGLRVAFVSDVHHGPYFSRERVRNAVARVNALHPDVIVLGGDYVYRSAEFVEPVFAELGRLQAPLGVYAVLGNHDHWVDPVKTRKALAASRIRALDNRGYWLQRGSSRIRLCGVDDLWEGRQDLAAAVDGATTGDFVLLASHNPDFVETLGGEPVDLVLSGHTHGGQVTLFGLWAPAVPSDYGQKYRAGLVLDGPVPAFVTTGVGTTVVPLRLFASPEVVLLTLRES
jgi:hypothetical protein